MVSTLLSAPSRQTTQCVDCTQHRTRHSAHTQDQYPRLREYPTYSKSPTLKRTECIRSPFLHISGPHVSRVFGPHVDHVLITCSCPAGLTAELSALRLQLARLARKTGNLGLAERALLDEARSAVGQSEDSKKTRSGDVMSALMLDVTAAGKTNYKPVSCSVQFSVIVSASLSPLRKPQAKFLHATNTCGFKTAL